MHNKYLIQAETQASDVFIWAVKYLNAMLLSCWCTWMTYFFMSTKGKKKKKDPKDFKLIVYLSLEEWKEMSKTSVGM